MQMMPFVVMTECMPPTAQERKAFLAHPAGVEFIP